MANKMSIRIKLFVLITLVTIITFSGVSAVVSYRSVEMAKDDAFVLADEMSAKYSYEIKSELQAARVTSESLMTVFKTLIERGEADRDTLNAILINSLEQKRYIISFCVAFEPDKLDGRDAEYAGQFPLYDESGRYAPYWSLQDGTINVEPLSDFDDDVWYAGARDSGGEYITDPFFYEVQGTQVLMTSLVFPIIIDGEFIGIVSSDMALDSLKEMVSHVNTSGLNEYTEIYSNSALVIAHPDDNYFNKSIYSTSAYNMLISRPSMAKDALSIAEEYLKNNAPRDDSDEARAEYEDAAAFVQNLAAYAKDPGSTTLDLKLMPNDLAVELLGLDEDRLTIARQATEAVENGQQYTVVEDDYYKVYTPISFSEHTNPWSVAVNVPISSVLKRSTELRNYVILVSAAGIVIIALLMYVITRNLTKPILNLARYARRVGEGYFEADIPEYTSNDEVGTLSAAFRTMMRKINDLIGELTENSEELSRKNEHLSELNVMLVEARDQAEASNRAKSVFLSNMSHEMRTPLNAIMGMTAIGQRATEDDKKADAFRKIDEASAHLLSLINDVLNMSKLETNMLELSPTSFDPRKLLDDAAGMMQFKLDEKEQSMNVVIDDGIPESLYGDSFRLSQVLVNLLSNAVKFTGEKGNIGLRAFVKELSEEAYTLQFEVSDDGIGMNAEQQERLFKMFEQADNSTSRSFGGTGLGLALASRIVGMMGGEIWVESEPGMGSTFFFTAVLAPGAGEADLSVENRDGTGIDDDFSGKRILLAEDIEINREIVIAMLEDTNIEIDCAANGQEAYDMVSVNPGRYDMILMDIQMPVMDGVEATKLIRELDAEVPIIALTANVFKEDIEYYLEIGINGHIGKPLDYDLTIEMLRKYLK